MVVPNIEIGMWVKKVIDFDAAGIYTFWYYNLYITDCAAGCVLCAGEFII